MSTITPNTVRPMLRDIQGNDLQVGDLVLFADANFLHTGCVVSTNMREGSCRIASVDHANLPLFVRSQKTISRKATTYRGYNATLLKELFPHRKDTRDANDIPW